MPTLAGFKEGTLTWTPDWGAEWRFVHAGAFGHEVPTPCSSQAHGLDVAQWSYYEDGGAHSEHALTALIVSDSDAATYSVSITYTRGVLSMDEASGHGIVKTREQFSQGAHATVDPFIPVGGAGALLREQYDSQHDLLGWFTPIEVGAGITKWNMTKNGVPLHQNDWGGVELYSHKPTRWDATIDADVIVQQANDGILGLIELPDNSYLTAVDP